MSRRVAAAVAMVALTLVLNAGVGAQEPPTSKEDGAVTTQTRFYCDIKALTPTERISHKRLTDKLIAVRKKIAEGPKGYEFQYSPSEVSLAELSEWVAAESRCCPFFDFHIDVERQGTLFCLRLTGDEGIKPFIVAEFQVPGK
jgi:hypothetical protein